MLISPHTCDFPYISGRCNCGEPLQELGPDRRERNAALRQAIADGAQFLANRPTLARPSYVHLLVQGAFANDFDSDEPVKFDLHGFINGPEAT